MTNPQPTLSRCYRDSTPEEKLHDAQNALMAAVREYQDDQESLDSAVSYLAATAKQREVTVAEVDEITKAQHVAKDSLQKLALHVANIIDAAEYYLKATTPRASTVASDKTTSHASTVFAGRSGVETTPDGRAMHAPGAKADAGKNRMSLVLHGFAHAFEAVSALGTHGAEKYSPRGFLEVENGFARYSDALLRHFIAEETEGDVDVSGSLHATCVAWNALARLEIKQREIKQREAKHNVGTN